jgi:hypothetical protein
MQMAPNMPPRPPMAPYGMLNGQPMQMGTMEMQHNGGQMPGMVPGPGGMGTFPVGTQFPGQPGSPRSQVTSPANVLPTQYPPSTTPTSSASSPSSPPRRPTLAELASPSQPGSR